METYALRSALLALAIHAVVIAIALSDRPRTLQPPQIQAAQWDCIYDRP